MSKYYITTAIAYTSRTPHIGNTYEAVLADSIARYRRMMGDDVYFLTGTDEHGQKIQAQAEQANMTPKQHVDIVAKEVKDIWDTMNVSYDQFIRTTDEQHIKTVQKIFKRLYDQGDIYKGVYEGWYCVACESFYTETQLTDGCCPDCGAKVIRTSEEAYYFNLQKYADRLIKYIDEHPNFIQPESRKNEMINNFLKPGLSDLCVSRTSFNWGVPVTFDEKHVVYVWIDALSNYISALGYDTDGENGELFNKYWPADVHLIGKDILRFHTIYWPIMLMALDIELPKQVFGHPWLLSGEDKMSKSKGNVVYAKDLVNRFGVDAVRYYMLHEMPFAQDGTFTYSLLISRINSDLANILGNLVNRTVAMVNKYFDSVIPNNTCPGEFDSAVISLALQTEKKTTEKMSQLKVADALDEIWTLLRRLNKYIDETCPWTLAKDEKDKERLGTVLYNLIEGIRFSCVLLKPFLPETADKIASFINADANDYSSLSSFGMTKSGQKLGKSEILFNRIDESKVLSEIEAEIQAKVEKKDNTQDNTKKEENKKPENTISLIDIEDFSKVELRVAQILECEPVEKSDKLLKLIVDLGNEKRQVVSGIAKYYSPAQLVSKKVILVCNLKPVKLRGVESNGMILAADSKDNVCVLFADSSIENGAKVR